MNEIISKKQSDIEVICREYHVKLLELFGSITSSRFDLQKSDIDFLVTFEELIPREHADAYFGLLTKLEALFAQHIDLVELKAIKNPYLLETVEKSRTTLYAA